MPTRLTVADLAFFTAVAHAPSLTAAARALDVTPSAVTQRLQDLERRLGVRLLERRGRTPTLTTEGELLASRGAQIHDDVDALEEALVQSSGVVSGDMRVLAPMGFGRAHVAPIVAAFRDRHPAVRVELMLRDRLGKVPESAWDVAIHIGDAPTHSLRSIRLAGNARVLCASPAFIEAHGKPSSPADVASMPCIALRENDEDVTLWRFTSPAGDVQQIRIAPVLASNDGDVVRAWALAGCGIIVRSEWSVAGDLRDGALVQLLPDYRLSPADVVAFVAARRDRSARVSAFVKLLRETLSNVVW